MAPLNFLCSSSVGCHAPPVATLESRFCSLQSHARNENLAPKNTTHSLKLRHQFSRLLLFKCRNMDVDAHDQHVLFDTDGKLVHNMVYDALVWSSLHGFVVGDKEVQRSGKIPGCGMVHAPFSLLPLPFPESQWKLACEVAPIFNELADRVSLDGKFLQDSLSRTKKVDTFTARLLDIHAKILDINKKDDIRLGLHRSDYMLDKQAKTILQVELNTISSSFAGLGSLVTKLHRYLLKYYGENIGLNSIKTPENDPVSRFAEALAQAWAEYDDPGAVIMFVVQPEEQNMYDQHWLCSAVKEKNNITIIRKTLSEIDTGGQLATDRTLLVDGRAVAVIYFRAGYAPSDYPSEAEWRARLMMEQSKAVKCPSIAYHLAGTKKIQQELASPGVLERFIDSKEDIAKLRKCFAGLWSLHERNTVQEAIDRPNMFVLKPQREGGGNNIYGNNVREKLLRLQKEGTEEDAAYILMQKIFPTLYPAILVREGVARKDQVISELGIYGSYLRNKDRVIINNASGYLARTKASTSNEGGIAAGFAVLDSIYLTDDVAP